VDEQKKLKKFNEIREISLKLYYLLDDFDFTFKEEYNQIFEIQTLLDDLMIYLDKYIEEQESTHIVPGKAIKRNCV